MRTLFCLCLFALLSANVPGSLLTAADLPVVQVPPTPTPAQVTAAKTAFANGSIVAMAGGTIAEFEALLNVAMPQSHSNSHHRQPPPCMQAVHKLPSGVIRKFIRDPIPSVAESTATCEADFAQWVAQQSLFENTALPGWTYLGDDVQSTAQTSSMGNNVSAHLYIYRANSIDAYYDYYLVLLNVNLKQVGGWTAYDVVTGLRALIGNGVQATSDSSGPNEQNKQISIGSDVPFLNNQSFPYQQSAQVFALSRSGSDALQDWSPSWYFQPDQYTATSAAIFKVPAGTPSLTIASTEVARFDIYHADIDDIEYDTANNKAENLTHVTVPYVSMPLLTYAMVGTTASFDVGASSYLQLKVSSNPSWVDPSSIYYTQSNGESTSQPMGSTTVSFSVPSDLSCLDQNTCVGNFAMQTVPPFSSPQTGVRNIASTTVDVIPSSPLAGVLIAGGQDWNGTVLQTADIWNSQKRTVTKLQSQMVQARYGHTATLIAPSTNCPQAGITTCKTTGQILITGGFGADGQPLSSTELFDPSNGQFRQGPYMADAHAEAVALQLQDGRVLILGGLDQPNSATAVVDIYDPITNSFSTTPLALTIPRWNFAASLLQDGSVLVQGGSNGPTEYDGPATATAEKLDNCGSGFYPLNNGPVVGRQALAATVLQNGQVFSVGGYNGNVDGGGPLGDVELFTPDGGSFSTVTPLQTGVRWAAVVMQEDGKVAVIGGDDSPSLLSTFDPASNSFVGSSYLGEQRDFPTAVRLEGTNTVDQGRILIAGGVIPNTGRTQGRLVEIYDPKTQRDADYLGADVSLLSAARRFNTTTLYGTYAGSLPATLGCQ